MNRHIRSTYRSAESGFLVLSLMIASVFIILLMVATMQIVVQNNNLTQHNTYKLQSQLAADSGADYAVTQLIANSDWTAPVGEVELSNDTTTRTTYEIDVTTPVDGQTKTITAYGRTYVPATSTTAKSTSKVQVGMKGSGASVVDGTISAYIGVGGLNMSGSSKVSGGVAFSNGPITMTGTSQIGSASNPVDTYVSNLACPVSGGSDFPRICNSGENENPINIPSWGTHIYGQVKANNQVSGTGMANPGLVPGTVAASSLPTDDRATRTQTINNPGQIQTGATASCSGSTTKTWPADLKIIGNVTLQNSCSITVSGDVWITGNLTVSGATHLRVQAGLTTPPHILIDGSTGFQILNSGQLTPNASGTGFRVITYYSTDPCSVTASGCDVSGSALFNSKSLRTILINGSTSSLKTQYYARWTKVNLDNSADVGALIGQTVELTGTAEIHSGVEIDPSQPGTLSWTVSSYKRSY
ncbi:MAG: hypothetical protein H6797_01435 [Candidatus Nomurabacteria bacterium]|nr:MAG: hypothetical protein H6797_01435 [Candidatus Nomurabacteria bacterium]